MSKWDVVGSFLKAISPSKATEGAAAEHDPEHERLSAFGLAGAADVHQPLPQLSPEVAAALSEEEVATAQMLLDHGQAHLFSEWDAPGTNDDRKSALLAHAKRLDEQYPGGLPAYLANARQLLADAEAGLNPMDDVAEVRVPLGKTLCYGSPEMDDLEQAGLAQADKLAFVLVAGGLGERLGFSGIKLSLPVELNTEQCYLGLYCASILALQAHARAAGATDVTLPLVIMTSDDTHLRTVELLEANGNFGMAEGQVRLVKQEKVAALNDSSASIATAGPYELITKPHGHGDVHVLLRQAGIAQQWAAQGKEWIVFFQDTNGLMFRSLAACVGVSASLGFDMNSVCIPRKAKSETGAITQLVFKDGRVQTTNTEYNQLGPLLEALGHSDGDVADASGFSPYPGNTNQLILRLSLYNQVLQETGGVMEEFVNPKYTDSTRTAFKKPTRLECMMQDVAKALPSSAVVGFTTCEDWIGYSPAKNNLAAAVQKIAQGLPGWCPTTAEADMYQANAEIWRRHGCALEAPIRHVFGDVPVDMGPRLTVSPNFASSRQDLARALPNPDQVRISARSCLVVRGAGSVVIESLDLDGALIIDAPTGTSIVVRGLSVKNMGWVLEPLVEGADVPESIAVRGFTLNKVETEEIRGSTPGPAADKAAASTNGTLLAEPATSGSLTGAPTTDEPELGVFAALMSPVGAGTLAAAALFSMWRRAGMRTAIITAAGAAGVNYLYGIWRR